MAFMLKGGFLYDALDFYGGFYCQAPISARTLARGLVNPENNLLGSFCRLYWHACAETIIVHVKDFEIFRCPPFENKNDTEIKS